MTERFLISWFALFFMVLSQPVAAFNISKQADVVRKFSSDHGKLTFIATDEEMKEAWEFTSEKLKTGLRLNFHQGEYGSMWKWDKCTSIMNVRPSVSTYEYNKHYYFRAFLTAFADESCEGGAGGIPFDLDVVIEFKLNDINSAKRSSRRGGEYKTLSFFCEDGVSCIHMSVERIEQTDQFAENVTRYRLRSLKWFPMNSESIRDRVINAIQFIIDNKKKSRF